MAVQLIGDLRLIATNELLGVAELAPLLETPHCYALGMLDGLKGEVLVLDSQAYIGLFEGDDFCLGTLNGGSVAFLAHTVVPEWRSIPVPPEVSSFKALQDFIGVCGAASGFEGRICPFRLIGQAGGLRWFVVNGMGPGLPTPRDSFLAQRHVGQLAEPVRFEAFGVYTSQHHGIATNLASNIHMHFKTCDDPPFLAHVDDELSLLPGAILYLPKDGIQ